MRINWKGQLFGQLLWILALALALGIAIAQLDLAGRDVPRHVLNEPSDHALGPPGCAPFC